MRTKILMCGERRTLISPFTASDTAQSLLFLKHSPVIKQNRTDHIKKALVKIRKLITSIDVRLPNRSVMFNMSQ